jgi:hypothetical protein
MQKSQAEEEEYTRPELVAHVLGCGLRVGEVALGHEIGELAKSHSR